MDRDFGGKIYQLIKPAFIAGCFAISGCANSVNREEYDAARKSDAETIRMLTDRLAESDNRYEKALDGLKKLVTERTTIDALIPKVAEAKEDILKQLQKDYNELTEKLKTEGEKLEGTRRTTVSDLEQLKRWFDQNAKPAIGDAKDETGIYADRKNIENHETRLANQKRALHNLEQNLAYQKIVEEWSYSLYLDYRARVENETGTLQNKLDSLNSVKPEERAAALEAFEREITTFEKNIDLLYQDHKEKRKKLPPRPEEKK
jgi:chromosome segregation ATPase